MRFSIILPTYKNASGLLEAVDSLIKQTYKDWEVIIINDSPFDKTYSSFASHINDARIHYRVNETSGSGINYSKNKALQNVSADSKWIIFLDDTTYLSPDTLATLHDLILVNQNHKWFATNQAQKNGTPLTMFPKSDISYKYIRDCLLLRRGKGNRTDCIETRLATSAKFSQHVKQNEDWFYFYQIGLQEKIFYHDHNSTISDLTNKSSKTFLHNRTISERIDIVTRLLYEGGKADLLYRPTFIIYIIFRYIRSFI